MGEAVLIEKQIVLDDILYVIHLDQDNVIVNIFKFKQVKNKKVSDKEIIMIEDILNDLYGIQVKY